MKSLEPRSKERSGGSTNSDPFASFQRVYIINLASRPDRRAEMAEQLSAVGLSLQSPRICLFPAVQATTSAGFPTLGARGCFLSHLGVLQDATRSGLDRILILVDDVNFAGDLLERAPTVFDAIEGWSFFYGGYEVSFVLDRPRGPVEVSAGSDVRTSHFVALQGEAIEAAAGYLGAMLDRPAGHPDGGPMHVDGAYICFRKSHPSLLTLIAVPPLGVQRASRTDIHELRWFDRTPAMRELVAWLRRYRNSRLSKRTLRSPKEGE